MKKLPALLFLILFGGGTIFAQQEAITVSGRVTNTDTLAVFNVHVTARSGNEYVGMTTTNGQGFFTLSLPQSKSDYTLTFWSLGAEVKTITLPPESTHSLNVTLKLPSQGYMKGKSYYSPDGIATKTVYIIDNEYEVQVLADLLNYFPEFSISKDGILSYEGNENVLILFNAQPITTEDLEQLFLPPHTFVQLQVDHQERCHDCMVAVIHIISNPLQDAGFGGNVSAQYGFFHFANADVNLWLSKKKFDLNFQYNVDYEDDIFKGKFEYQHKSTADAATTEFKHQCRQLRNDFRLNGFFLLNDRNSLEVNVRAKVPRLLADHAYDNNAGGERWQSLENGFTGRRWQQESVEGTIRYRHIIQPYLSHRPNSSSFSLEGAVSKAWERREDTYREDFYHKNLIWASSQSSEGPLSATFKADFTIQRKHSTWQVGAQALYRRNGFSQNLTAAADSVPTAFQPLQYHFTHQEVVPSIYLNYIFAKHYFFLKAGLQTEYIRAGHNASDAWQSHLIFAPNLQLTFRITPHQSVGLEYRCHAERADYAELSPYRYMLDANTSLQGNPTLRPEIVNRVEARYNLTTNYVRLYADLFYQHTTFYISQIARFQENAISFEYVNIHHDARAGLDLKLRVGNSSQFWWILLNSCTYYRRAIARLDGEDWSNRGWTSDNSLELRYSPVHRYRYWLRLQADYHIITPQFHPQFTTSLSHYLNLKISHIFFYRLTVSLSATDVFNTARWEAHFDNGTYSLTHRNAHKTRMVWIGIAYRFGDYHTQFPNDTWKDAPRSNRLVSME
ncbi:MAG: TonB-dependent receptor [Bacteroidales bacterium]|nr:TonB-dependent receptor [Bacteroidales bacterium]